MKKEKVEFDNLSYKELQEIHSKLRKDFIDVDKRLKALDKSIGISSAVRQLSWQLQALRKKERKKIREKREKKRK